MFMCMCVCGHKGSLAQGKRHTFVIHSQVCAMASEPLLMSATDGSSDFKMTWVCMIRQWWSVSTSEVWLTSALSRRELLVPLLVMANSIFTIGDQLSDVWRHNTGRLITFAGDLTISALLMSVSWCFRQGSLRRDVVSAIAYGVVVVVVIAFGQACDAPIQPDLATAAELAFAVSVFACGGTHSSCILAMVLRGDHRCLHSRRLRCCSTTTLPWLWHDQLCFCFLPRVSWRAGRCRHEVG